MLIGFALIVGFYGLGELTQNVLGVPVPGSILGMLYLFGFLVWRRQVADSLQRSSKVLINNLALLLIPSSVGVITCAALLERQGVAIVLTLSISIVFSLLLTAWLLARLSRSQGTDQ